MRTEEYKRYIKSAAWEDKKQQRLEIDGGKCVMCGRPQSTCKQQRLQCHHVNYRRLGAEDPFTDLVTVCGTCHKKLHNYLSRRKEQYAE